MSTAFIYALKCPKGNIRYVGYSKDPYHRYEQHLDNNKRERTHKASWIRSLLCEGQVPILEVLDEVPAQFAGYWEIQWIKFFRLFPHIGLTNSTDGGDGGTPGRKLSPGHCAAIRAGNKGKKLSLECRKKLSEIKKGKKMSLEAGLNMSAAQKSSKLCQERLKALHEANKGKTLSPGHRQAIGDARRGKKLSPEHCQAIRKSREGKKHSPGTCQKISDAAKNCSPETRRKMSESKKKDERVLARLRALNEGKRGKKLSPETRAKMSASQKQRWARERAERENSGQH